MTNSGDIEGSVINLAKFDNEMHMGDIPDEQVYSRTPLENMTNNSKIVYLYRFFN